MNDKMGWELIMLLLLNKLRVDTGPLPVHYWTAVAIMLATEDFEKLHKDTL